MSFLHLASGFFMGTLFGVGIAIFYIRYKLNSQLGMMQQNMEEMFEATAEMNEAFSGVDDVKEADFKEKEVEDEK